MEDPRRTVGGHILHKLEDIIIIGLCTLLCNGEDFTDMEAFGELREEWLRKFLELRHGIPDSDTFRRVFERINPEALAAVFVTPASALEYTFDSPSTGDFGTPTSDETIYEWEDPNVDRSKSSALIPPGFGTPTSYLPNSGVYLTPNLAANGPLNSPSLTGTITGGGGAATLPGAVDAPVSSYPTTSYPTASGPVTAFTDVTDDLYYSDGSLGTLKIPAIGLTVKIVQGTDSAALAKGAGHFTDTSIWDGNVALAGHNRGVNNHFGKIHTLEVGDAITLTTQLGVRTYSVTSVSKVSETDNSMLAAASGNCVTLFTCVRDERDYRWCVRAVES